MWTFVFNHLNPRSSVPGALSVVLVMSLTCNMHLSELKDVIADIDALGVAFKASQRTIDRRIDKGQDIDDSSMLRHGVLPVPAVFAIGQNGIIEFAYANPDYKVRLPADELLQVVEGLAAGK